MAITDTATTAKNQNQELAYHRGSSVRSNADAIEVSSIARASIAITTGQKCSLARCREPARPDRRGVGEGVLSTFTAVSRLQS